MPNDGRKDRSTGEVFYHGQWWDAEASYREEAEKVACERNHFNRENEEES